MDWSNSPASSFIPALNRAPGIFYKTEACQVPAARLKLLANRKGYFGAVVQRFTVFLSIYIPLNQ